jgi:hypothetical protein
LKTRVGNGPTMYDLMKFRDPSMKDIMKFNRYETAESEAELKQRLRRPVKAGLSNLEVVADLGKWLTVTALLPPAGAVELTDFEQSGLIGFLAGCISQLVRENGGAQGANLEAIKSSSGSTIPFWRPVTNRRVRRPVSQDSPQPIRRILSKKINRQTGAERKSSSSKKKLDGVIDSIVNLDSTVLPDDTSIFRFSRSGIESAAQIVVYIAARDYVHELAPYFNQAS